jgi:hypothetical protein
MGVGDRRWEEEGEGGRGVGELGVCEMDGGIGG